MEERFIHRWLTNFVLFCMIFDRFVLRHGVVLFIFKAQYTGS